MELIKQIKEAENQASGIIEKAKQEAAELLEDAKKQHTELRKSAQQRRTRAIEDAVAQAELEGNAQAQLLADKGESYVSSLKASAAKKMPACVEKVVSRLQKVSD
jgi:vacuolar-type H+-ATPase subunit H